MNLCMSTSFFLRIFPVLTRGVGKLSIFFADRMQFCREKLACSEDVSDGTLVNFAI